MIDMNRAEFIERYGWVFEHSPWVAERAWSEGPFVSVGALHEAMTRVVQSATREEQLALLNAHPDLGTRARVSEASAGEQAGVGLDRLTQPEFDELTTLNAAYTAKFGFPFLFAVKGSTAQDIFGALKRRLSASSEDEFAEALRQVYKIASFRLEE